jgi:RNA polymerase sigma-70 factor (ECF subfamily)
MPDSYVQERELRTMVNELPEDRARMLLMFFEGYKYDEIAEDQGLKMGTVKSRIFESRKILSKKVLL